MFSRKNKGSKNRRSHADVVIIGAGAIGCSTAYHLAREGVARVVVLEMGEVGSGSSGKSASMLSLQFARDELLAKMASYSYARFMDFESELGVSTDFKKIGWLTLATEGSADNLRQQAAMLNELGIRTDLLDPAEIAYRYPEISTDDLALGSWGPDDGPFDPHMILWGYINRAIDLGVELWQGVRAQGLNIGGGRVQGVYTSQGFLSTPVVVNAAGPWAAEVAGWAGLEIPLVNKARSILVTGPIPDLPAGRPFVEDLSQEWYYRPEGAGVLMGMGNDPVEGARIDAGYDITEQMIDAAVQRVPLLARASVLTTWTGLRPLTVDDRPILGPVAGIEGLILNCGWGGMGIIQAPIAGQLAAEVIIDDRASTMDISNLRVDRFA